MLTRELNAYIYNPDVVSLSPHLLFGFLSLPDSLAPLVRDISDIVHKNPLIHYQERHGQSLHCQ